MEMNSELSKLKALGMSIIDETEGDADKQNIAIKEGDFYNKEFELFKNKIIQVILLIITMPFWLTIFNYIIIWNTFSFVIIYKIKYFISV